MSTIKQNINTYAKDINEASEDERIRTAITRAIASYRKTSPKPWNAIHTRQHSPKKCRASSVKLRKTGAN